MEPAEKLLPNAPSREKYPIATAMSSLPMMVHDAKQAFLPLIVSCHIFFKNNKNIN